MSVSKICVVPECRSTSATTPAKLFFDVPSDKETKEKWFKIMNIDNDAVDYSRSGESVSYCCEDHFDLISDTEDYIGDAANSGLAKLKEDVVPHKFDCYKNADYTPEEKKQRNKQLLYAISDQVRKFELPDKKDIRPPNWHEALQEPATKPVRDNKSPTVNKVPTRFSHNTVAVQVNLPKLYRSVGINTDSKQRIKKPRYVEPSQWYYRPLPAWTIHRNIDDKINEYIKSKSRPK